MELKKQQVMDGDPGTWTATPTPRDRLVFIVSSDLRISGDLPGGPVANQTLSGTMSHMPQLKIEHAAIKT